MSSGDFVLSVTGEQINNYVANGLDKNLDRLSEAGQKVIDGQWVNAANTIVSGGTWAVQSYEYDLSSYLPEDDYTYEVGFSAWVTSISGGKGSMIFIRPINITRSSALVTVGTLSTTSSSSFTASGNIILPIDKSRKFIIGVTTNGTATGTANLVCWGYRRVGTNN